MDEQTKTGFSEANEESLGAYQKGYEDGIRELARRIGLYYRSLGASQTLGYMVEYTVNEKVRDMLDDQGV